MRAQPENDDILTPRAAVAARTLRGPGVQSTAAGAIFQFAPTNSRPGRSMTLRGYSDRINHALGFAAKHHDQQVRKGTRLPYLTRPANVAMILLRYGQDETTIVSGILYDVIEDCVRDGYTRDALEQRIGDKFGVDVLEAVLAVTHRKLDDDGVELSAEDRKADYLHRLDAADERARWVCAADKVHDGSSILADLRRTEFPENVWSRFAAGREGAVRWYRQVHDRLHEIGFRAPIMSELADVAAALEQWTEPADARSRRG